MKLLSNKTLRNYKTGTKVLVDAVDELNKRLQQAEAKLKTTESEFASYITTVKTNFSIKRFIVGKKGSGKTTLVKSILTKLKNYYLIDVTGEYDFIPEQNRFIVNHKNPDQIVKVKEAIQNNSDKVIIIDDAGLLSDTLDWFMLHSRHLDYIITTQSKSKIEKYIDEVDFIYDLGTIDEWCKPVNKNKFMELKNNKPVGGTVVLRASLSHHHNCNSLKSINRHFSRLWIG